MMEECIDIKFIIITTNTNLLIEKNQKVMEKINNLICRKDGKKLLQVLGSIGNKAGEK